jgi:hypothetical protein
MDFKRAKTDKDFTPSDYFCKYNLILDSDIAWQLDIYRYLSHINTETIEIIQFSSVETYYDDNYLREHSFIYTDNGIGNMTSHASIEMKSQTTTV